jgi:hypothetical protein
MCAVPVHVIFVVRLTHFKIGQKLTTVGVPLVRTEIVGVRRRARIVSEETMIL